MANDLFSLARNGNLERLKALLEEANQDLYAVIEEDMNLNYITESNKATLENLVSNSRPSTTTTTNTNTDEESKKEKKGKSKTGSPKSTKEHNQAGIPPPGTASSTQSKRTTQSSDNSVVSFKDIKGPWYNQTHPLTPSLYLKKTENIPVQFYESNEQGMTGSGINGNGVKRHLRPVNQTRWSGDTIIHRACIGGHLNVVKYLVEEADADFRVKSVWGGYTPLHLAAKYGHEDVCEYLISKESDWEDTDKKGRSCFDYCVEGGNTVLAWKLNKWNEDRKHARERERQQLWIESLRSPTPSTASTMENGTGETIGRKKAGTERGDGKGKKKKEGQGWFGGKSEGSPKSSPKNSPKNTGKQS